MVPVRREAPQGEARRSCGLLRGDRGILGSILPQVGPFRSTHGGSLGEWSLCSTVCWYNQHRTYMALGLLTPDEAAAGCQLAEPVAVRAAGEIEPALSQGGVRRTVFGK